MVGLVQLSELVAQGAELSAPHTCGRIGSCLPIVDLTQATRWTPLFADDTSLFLDDLHGYGPDLEPQAGWDNDSCRLQKQSMGHRDFTSHGPIWLNCA